MPTRSCRPMLGPSLMRFLACVSAPVVVCTCLLLLGAICATPAHGQPVCHDGNWEDGEFCGRDAVVATGEPEMNHDCIVDALDFALFAQDYGNVGPGLSGDFNADGVVDLFDLTTFASRFCGSVSPCNSSGMLPDGCLGKIALSFSPDSTNIVSTTTLPSGRIYVVVDGWTNAQTIEFGIETSPNVLITLVPTSPYPYWTGSGGIGSCDPNAQYSERLYTVQAVTWPSGPINFAHLNYMVTDASPAWVKLVPPDHPSCGTCGRLRWAEGASNRSFDFSVVMNAGINGPAPPGENTCTEQQQVPATSGLAIVVVGILMLMLAFWSFSIGRKCT